MGVEASRLETIGYGETKPVGDNSSASEEKPIKEYSLELENNT